MKKELITILLFNLCCLTFAQNDVFVYGEDGLKEYFEVNKSVKYVQFNESASELMESLSLGYQDMDTVMPDILRFTLDKSEIGRFEQSMSRLESVYCADELIYKDSTIQWCFNKILLQTNGSIDLKKVLEDNRVPYRSFQRFGLDENEYLVSLSVSESLNYSNSLYETGMFVYVTPAFYRTSAFHNPSYPKQYASSV
ncbi:hypothetical protein [Bacteroides heparinolyticus]|uniref:hypothetical protein n=1 Tax=Prevotella heparinolytica TaxID=28113 RepID=UPI0035A114DB